MIAVRLVSVAMLFAVTSTAGAQHVRRPKLDANADTNDWESYYQYAVRNLQRFPTRAYQALYWASRLAPWSADPLYAQWVAFHMQDIARFQRYLDDDQKVHERPDVRRVDSLTGVALTRNPFVHRSLEVALYDLLPGHWGTDVHTRAWLAYATEKLDQATVLFGRAIAQQPDKRYRLRHIRAALFVARQQYDSALTEMTALLDKARQLDEKAMVHHYESKAFYEYAIGRLELARNDRRAARAAFERAITEDLTYGPAHFWLATLLELNGDTSAAMASYTQAIDIDPTDPIYRYQYAVFLIKAKRPQEALAQADQAIALEPFYTDAYVIKAAAQEQLGQPDSARATYRAYLDLAARNGKYRVLATQRLAALAPPSTP